MRFGIFLPNGSNGYIPSKGSPIYEPTFEHNKRISQEAEDLGFDFVLSMMKYRGFGGETGYWDSCLESFTLMSAIASVTSSIGLFPSISILSQHPAVVARMIATIDDISDGRCGLNIVTGWNKAEYEQMGMWPGSSHYTERYTYAKEYVDILKSLWKYGRCTYEGKFFKLDDCIVSPRPKGAIPIVCAGQSPKGKQFVAENANHQFVMTGKKNLITGVADITARSSAVNRKVGIYALYHMIIAETDEAAKDITEKIVREVDTGAVSNILSSAALDTNPTGTSDQLKAALKQDVEEGNMAFMGIPVLYGSVGTLVEKIKKLEDETGIDGLLFSWPNFLDGLRIFGREIAPNLT